jgi:glycosyltransferase involved in cell wall biosynthesis
MGCLARKNNRKIVLDMDDALWYIQPDNTAYQHYQKGGEAYHNVTAIANEVDYITTTNGYLRNIIASKTNKSHNKIEVFPNYIDFNLYSHRSEFKDTVDIQLLHFGSSSHFKDLQDEEFCKAIDRLFREYPNLTLKTIGAMISKYKIRWGQRYSHDFGHVDLYTWVKEKMPIFLDQTDILVTPLTDNVYNKAKSSIKFIEGSSYKKPGVWQRIRQYEEVIKDGENGFLARTEDEWYFAIKRLIDDKVLRKKCGENAFKTTEEDWQIHKNIYRYANFFKRVLTS